MDVETRMNRLTPSQRAVRSPEVLRDNLEIRGEGEKSRGGKLGV